MSAPYAADLLEVADRMDRAGKPEIAIQYRGMALEELSMDRAQENRITFLKSMLEPFSAIVTVLLDRGETDPMPAQTFLSHYALPVERQVSK